MPFHVVTLGLVGVLLSSPRPAVFQPADSPIQCEFRVFEGDQEVTSETTLKIYPSGKRDGGSTLDPAERLRIALPAGLYDVQAVRARQGKVISIRWAERLVVMHYPDEAGFHLEAINFTPGYGALQLRPAIGAAGDMTMLEARAAKTGARGEDVGKTVRGDKYLLLVLPAGTYDVQLRAKDSKDGEWIAGIEVPADSTRLKTVPLPKR